MWQKYLTIKNVLIVLLILGIFIAYHRRGPALNHKSSNKAVLEELRQIRDENFNLLSEIRLKEVKIEEQESLLDSIRNTVPKPLRPKISQIKSVEKFTLSTDTSLKLSIVHDSTIKIEKHDPWLSAFAEIHNDSASLTIGIKDTITRTEIYKRHLFKPDEHYILLRSSSPYSSIQEGFSFTIKEKKTVLTIGPSINYSPFVNRISFGISVQLPILKIKK